MPWNTDADQPLGVAPPATRAPRRAAVAVWAAAGVQLLVFGCYASLLAGLGAIPAQAIREGMSEQVPADQLEQIIQNQPAMLVGAVVLTLLMVLPALALLVLGFYVRQRRRGAILAARVILFIQAGLVGLMLALNLAAGVTTGDVVALVTAMVFLGGTLALIVWTLRALGAAAREANARHSYHDTEPWNSHLT